MLVVITIFFGVICAVFCGKIARAKGFDQAGWAMAGLLLGPLALIAAAGLPDIRTQRYLSALVEHKGIRLDETDSPLETGSPAFTTMHVFSSEEVWEKTLLQLHPSLKELADIGQSKINRNEILVRDRAGKLLARATANGNVTGPKRWTIRYTKTG